jgi:hypothetical protein
MLVQDIIIISIAFNTIEPISKGVFYSGIKTCNHLPSSIKDLSHDINQFK